MDYGSRRQRLDGLANGDRPLFARASLRWVTGNSSSTPGTWPLGADKHPGPGYNLNFNRNPCLSTRLANTVNLLCRPMVGYRLFSATVYVVLPPFGRRVALCFPRSGWPLFGGVAHWSHHKVISNRLVLTSLIYGFWGGRPGWLSTTWPT